MMATKDVLTWEVGRKRKAPLSMPTLRILGLCVALVFLSMVCADEFEGTTHSESQNKHGVDVSWPMQHDADNERYKNFMDGCYRQGLRNYNKRADGLYQRKDSGDIEKNEINKEQFLACNNAERDRLEMNLNQPKAMQNYTHAGYAKVQTPIVVKDILANFWNENSYNLWPEFWNRDNTYVNHWEVPTLLLDIGRKDLPRPLTTQEHNTIIQSIQDVLESWTNQRLVLTSAYGIRVYQEGAILAPHVDRLPLVSSAIINIFQLDVAEPWVLEVIGHDGMAHNLTSEPTEMILYESASIIHGRPYPLKGKGAAVGSLFVHFEPLYHSYRHSQMVAGDHYSSKTAEERNLESKNAFEKALENQMAKPTLEELVSSEMSETSNENGKKTSAEVPYRKPPDYVWPEYKDIYDQRFYFEYNDVVYPKSPNALLSNLNSHQAASMGQLDILKEIARTQSRNELFKADHNGWRPIHEAARSGQADVLEYLIEEGANINERTNNNNGGNALFWAKKNAKKNAKAIAVLEKYGAVVIEPRFTDKNKAKKTTSTQKEDDEKTKKKES